MSAPLHPVDDSPSRPQPRSPADLFWSFTWLATQQVPVQQLTLAQNKALPPSSGPQVMVLTDAVAQATVDLAVCALAAHPAVNGPVVTLRVEMLEG